LCVQVRGGSLGKCPSPSIVEGGKKLPFSKGHLLCRRKPDRTTTLEGGVCGRLYGAAFHTCTIYALRGFQTVTFLLREFFKAPPLMCGFCARSSGKRTLRFSEQGGCSRKPDESFFISACGSQGNPCLPWGVSCLCTSLKTTTEHLRNSSEGLGMAKGFV